VYKSQYFVDDLLWSFGKWVETLKRLASAVNVDDLPTLTHELAQNMFFGIAFLPSIFDNFGFLEHGNTDFINPNVAIK
jgi:hypothetical protein